MDDIKTNIIYRRKDIWDYYYADKILKSSAQKSMRTNGMALIMLIPLLFFALTKCSRGSDYMFVTLLLVLPTLVCSVVVGHFLIQYLGWRSNAKAYIDYLTSFKTVELTVNDKGVGIGFDTDLSFRTWEVINKYELSDTFIKLHDNLGGVLLIPSKSLKTDEFNKFRQILLSKIKADNI